MIILQPNYDKKFITDINGATNMTVAGLKNAPQLLGPDSNPPTVRIIYHNKDEYKQTVRQLGLMEDFRVNT